MQTEKEMKQRRCVLMIEHRTNVSLFAWMVRKAMWSCFPWYMRNVKEQVSFCIGSECVYWSWENSRRHRGFCAHADSRTVNDIWKESKTIMN